MSKPKIKICCISSIDEAQMAIKLGASAIGLVSEMPSGPGVISEEAISEIAKTAPADIKTFLLTSKQNTKEIIEQIKRCNPTTVQIVDELLDGDYEDIKRELPQIEIVQVLHVNDESSIHEAVRISKNVDAVLLDSGNQKLDVKELGGTGRTHDWSISKKIVDAVSVPVFLAGGINSKNVVDAIKSVNPYGLDLCSSVRTNDKLDPDKITEFFNTINSR